MTDYTPIIVAIIIATPSTIAAIFSLLSLRKSKDNETKLTEIHSDVNGKMSQLLKVTAKASKAEGVKEGLEQHSTEG